VSDFTGQVVMITGAAGGIGQVMARLFGERGAAIAALDRNDAVHDVAAALNDEGIAAAAAVADVGAADEVAAATAAFRAALGPVSVLVNNAGFSSAATVEETTPASWADDVNLNLNGAFNCAFAVLQDLKDAGNAAVVNISSVNGFVSYGDPAYSAAKAGLINFTKTFAMEYGRFGVRANVVCPGTVRTPIWNQRLERQPEIFDELARFYPLRRVVEPIDVARAAVFLASADAAAITGATLTVDCGLSAGNIAMTRDLTLEEL
jgi:NAD(P)-dependent dehydrogenase (short-subunit alcohol dehydrogenase family)